MNQRSLPIIVGILVSLGSCVIPQSQAAKTTPQQISKIVQLNFELTVRMGSGDYTDMRLLIHNLGSADFRGDETFNGSMKLFDETGNQLTGSVLPTIQTIPSTHTSFATESRQNLARGKYRLVFAALSYGSTEINFTVAKRKGRLYIVNQQPCKNSVKNFT